MRTRAIPVISGVALLMAFTNACLGQEAPKENASKAPASSGDSELAKKTQNPVSDLISIPFENDFNFGAGADGEFSYSLTIKPVYPQRINDEWNWIHRALIPAIVDQPNLGPDNIGQACGFGDIEYQGYLSPAKSEGWVWGVGPVFDFPTASDSYLGTEKWSAGVGGVVLRMEGPWVVGALANNVWSYAGDGDRDSVNRMTVQPFINYNFEGGFYLTAAPVITANWSAPQSGEIWTIPVGGGVGKIIRVGKLPVNITLQAYYLAAKPDGGPDWEVRFQFAPLFPKS